MQGEEVNGNKLDSGARRETLGLGNRQYRHDRGSKKPVKLKGHEAFIKALEMNQVPIEIQCLDSDEIIIATIRHSDKYSVSIVTEDRPNSIRLLYKHAIKFIDAPLAPTRGSTDSEEGHY